TRTTALLRAAGHGLDHLPADRPDFFEQILRHTQLTGFLCIGIGDEARLEPCRTAGDASNGFSNTTTGTGFGGGHLLIQSQQPLAKLRSQFGEIQDRHSLSFPETETTADADGFAGHRIESLCAPSLSACEMFGLHANLALFSAPASRGYLHVELHQPHAQRHSRPLQTYANDAAILEAQARASGPADVLPHGGLLRAVLRGRQEGRQTAGYHPYRPRPVRWECGSHGRNSVSFGR